MKIINISNVAGNEEKVCAVGNFDGFHKGHLKILNSLKEEAENSGLKSAVITFDPHPKEVLKGERLCKIISPETQIEFLKNIGIDYLITISFSKEFASIDKKDFLKLLKDKLNCRKIIVGADWRFGKNKKGDVSFAKKFGKEIGIDVEVVNLELKGNQKISSSDIREFLKKGKIEDVNHLLGRIYCLTGNIIRGNKIGSKIGFPTINIKVDENLCLKTGVYVGYIEVGNEEYRAVINWGKRPTVDGKNKVLEIHIIEGFNEKAFLENEKPKVYFLHYVRNEIKFKNIHQLKEQIKKDILYSLKYFEQEGSNAVNI